MEGYRKFRIRAKTWQAFQGVDMRVAVEMPAMKIYARILISREIAILTATTADIIQITHTITIYLVIPLPFLVRDNCQVVIPSQCW